MASSFPNSIFPLGGAVGAGGAVGTGVGFAKIVFPNSIFPPPLFLFAYIFDDDRIG